VTTPRIELHGAACACRGGSWVLLDGTTGSPCSGSDATSDTLLLTIEEWKQLGKPASLEAYQEAERRHDAGERRQFERYEVHLPVRLERIPTWREASAQSEDTIADVIAVGGALVRSRMAVDRGDLLRFALADYSTRAEVMYVASKPDGDTDGAMRLGLKFLDLPMPESFIPEGARPLP